MRRYIDLDHVLAIDEVKHRGEMPFFSPEQYHCMYLWFTVHFAFQEEPKVFMMLDQGPLTEEVDKQEEEFRKMHADLLSKWENKQERQEHLKWIYERLISKHGENPNFDYMHKLKDIIDGKI